MPFRSRAFADVTRSNPPRWALLNLLDPGSRAGLNWRMPTRSNSSLALLRKKASPVASYTEFLRSVGVNSSQFPGAEVRRNIAVGPFTVSVAREVLGSIADNGKPLKWLQAERCRKELAAYLDEKGLADTRYCGLSTALARHIERELQSDNNAFAQSVWGRPWAEIFAADVAAEFTPNDFEVRPPDWFTARRLRRTVREMNAIAEEILRDPSLAIEALWNDWRHRSGLVSRAEPVL